MMGGGNWISFTVGTGVEKNLLDIHELPAWKNLLFGPAARMFIIPSSIQ